MKRFQYGLPIEDEPRKDRPCNLNKNRQRKWKDYTENRVGSNQRKLAAKFKVSRSYIRRNLEKLGLGYYKRRRAPKYTSQQLEQIPGKCQKLRRKITDPEIFIIMDNEKYFSFSGDNMPSNAGFWSADKEHVSPEVNFKSKQTFAPKILVRLAISSKGISAPYLGTAKDSAANGDIYIKQCLQKLLTFIYEHHQDD
ncbi:unnamed protein product [Rotaria magnacalcarata]|uniref:Uncharacterized protein n=1 Tax=Rotaria magnacalcarata TaxID=392030 RepID=A0A819G990_9BILA|nr:unnamed protein product [Rotaria magnacalcarata]CAF3881905.1 unnamed protein product [Rotaria magnacalcarata]